MSNFAELLAGKKKVQKDVTEKYVGMKLDIEPYKALASAIGLDPAVCTGADIFKAMLIATLEKHAPELLKGE